MFRHLLFIAILLFSANCAETQITADACNGLATAKVKAECLGTPDAAASTASCCLATFSTLPTNWKQHASSLATAIEAIQEPVSGGDLDGGKYYACFKKGAATHIRYKTGAAAFKDANFQGKEASFLSADVCSATGATPSALSATATTFFYTGSESSGTTNFESVVNVQTGAGNAANSVMRGLKAGTAPTCVCGNVRPVDACVGLAAASIVASCTSTPESSASGAKKCCKVTFDGIPTTPQSDTVEDAVTAPADAKGGIIVSSNYVACYSPSATLGAIVFKTKASSQPDAKESWVPFNTFCSSTALGKSQPHKDFKYAAVSITGKTTSTKAGISGKATSCECLSANVFTIGFTLLAILASLWK